MSTPTVENPKDALLAHQAELERLFDKNQLMPCVRAEFLYSKEYDYVGYLMSQRIPLEFGIDLLAQMAIHKRATVGMLVGMLRHHFDDSQVTANMLLRAVEASLLYWADDTKVFVVRFELTPDVWADLDRFQYPLPLVVEPLEIKNNVTTGYLVNTKGSVILRDNHHTDDVCLDHLNRMNRIRLTINETTVMWTQNRWKKLDKLKDDEDFVKYHKRRKAFDKFDSVCRDIITLLMDHNEVIYLTHRYDKRGRTYPQGYHVNTSGTPWSRAIVEFADKEVTV